MTATVAGLERSRVFDRPETILLEPCLEDWLADRPPGFEAGELTLLGRGIVHAQASEGQAARRRGPASRALPGRSSRASGTTSSGWFWTQTALCRSGRPQGGSRPVRRTTAEAAHEIAFRKMEGRDVLMYPLGREVGSPELLESLTVEFKWRDIPFDRFRLEDDRQHFVERSQDGDRYRAVVRIEPPKALPVPARLPITGPEFAAVPGRVAFHQAAR